MKELYTKSGAGIILRKAVKLGNLAKLSCQDCGDIKSEGHHPDYSKPLKVIWLCRKHHVLWHKKNGYPESKYSVRKFENHLRDTRKEIIFSLDDMGYSLGQLSSVFSLNRSTIMRIVKTKSKKWKKEWYRVP